MARYRAEGELGLLDRCCAPRSIPHRTSEQRVQAIAALRRLRFTGPEIAEVLGMARLTVSGILARIGMGKLGRLGLEPVKRYERQRPGELIHIDVKSPDGSRTALDTASQVTRATIPRGQTRPASDAHRSAGNACTSRLTTATRLAYAEVLTDEQGSTAVGFMRRAIAFYDRHGIAVQAVMIDGMS